MTHDHKALDRIDEILHECRAIEPYLTAVNTAVYIFQMDAPYLGYTHEAAEDLMRQCADAIDWHRPVRKVRAA